MSHFARVASVSFLAACAISSAQAATESPANEPVSYERLYPGWRFDPAIPTQESVLATSAQCHF